MLRVEEMIVARSATELADKFGKQCESLTGTREECVAIHNHTRVWGGRSVVKTTLFIDLLARPSNPIRCRYFTQTVEQDAVFDRDSRFLRTDLLKDDFDKHLVFAPYADGTSLGDPERLLRLRLSSLSNRVDQYLSVTSAAREHPEIVRLVSDATAWCSGRLSDTSETDPVEIYRRLKEWREDE